MDIKFDQQTFDIVLEEGGDGLVDLAITQSPADDLMQRLFSTKSTNIVKPIVE